MVAGGGGMTYVLLANTANREHGMRILCHGTGVRHAFGIGGGCRTAASDSPGVDPQLAREIAAIRAVDNHAHPVRPTAAGEAPDIEYDALPVDNLEPQSDPDPPARQGADCGRCSRPALRQQ